jgi:hypothetical protein
MSSTSKENNVRGGRFGGSILVGVEDIEQKNIIYILLCLIHIQLYRL